VAQATAREQVIEAIQHTLDNAQPQGMDAIVMFAEIDDFRFLNSSHEGAEVAEIIQPRLRALPERSKLPFSTPYLLGANKSYFKLRLAAPWESRSA